MPNCTVYCHFLQGIRAVLPLHPPPLSASHCRYEVARTTEGKGFWEVQFPVCDSVDISEGGSEDSIFNIRQSSVATILNAYHLDGMSGLN